MVSRWDHAQPFSCIDRKMARIGNNTTQLIGRASHCRASRKHLLISTRLSSSRRHSRRRDVYPRSKVPLWLPPSSWVVKASRFTRSHCVPQIPDEVPPMAKSSGRHGVRRARPGYCHPVQTSKVPCRARTALRTKPARRRLPVFGASTHAKDGPAPSAGSKHTREWDCMCRTHLRLPCR